MGETRINAVTSMREDGTVYHHEPLECLDDHGEGTCDGSVEYRMALSATGRSFPRCDRHWADRLDEQERINDRYPDSPIPPADFDPAYAGERWNED